MVSFVKVSTLKKLHAFVLLNFAFEINHESMFIILEEMFNAVITLFIAIYFQFTCTYLK